MCCELGQLTTRGVEWGMFREIVAPRKPRKRTARRRKCLWCSSRTRELTLSALDVYLWYESNTQKTTKENDMK